MLRCEGGDDGVLYAFNGYGISTHSAREDGDARAVSSMEYPKISTHSAREDGDFSLQLFSAKYS